MSSRWREFVAETVAPPKDDPYVRLLRDKVAAGARVVRVHLVDGRPPKYLLILEYRKQLSEMEIPHSESFTRWSLESGTRMADADEEVRRFALLLTEKLAALEREVGRDYFRSVLVEVLRELGPSATLAMLGERHEGHAAAGPSKDRALQAIESVLVEAIRSLGEALGYGVDESAEILDSALARYVDGLFLLSARRELFPEGWRR